MYTSLDLSPMFIMKVVFEVGQEDEKVYRNTKRRIRALPSLFQFFRSHPFAGTSVVLSILE